MWMDLDWLLERATLPFKGGRDVCDKRDEHEKNCLI